MKVVAGYVEALLPSMILHNIDIKDEEVNFFKYVRHTCEGSFYMFLACSHKSFSDGT